MTRIDRLRVRLARPIILYLARSPLSRGKGLITRRLLLHVLPPPPASFELRRPGGTRVRLQYREVLGMSALVNGGFEDGECALLLSLATPGSWAIDIGANVGIQTVPLARQVASGRVIAVEPLPENARRLRENAALNGLGNIDVHVVAAGAAAGMAEIHVANDPAYSSTGVVSEARSTGMVVRAPQRTIDDVWTEAGSPPVSVIKVDVEGAETDVLRGAQHLLAVQGPSVLAEASDASSLAALEQLLAQLGYRRRAAPILPWNHLFVLADRAARKASQGSEIHPPLGRVGRRP